jgi:hypothetical protein
LKKPLLIWPRSMAKHFVVAIINVACDTALDAAAAQALVESQLGHNAELMRAFPSQPRRDSQVIFRPVKFDPKKPWAHEVPDTVLTERFTTQAAAEAARRKWRKAHFLDEDTGKDT